MLEDYEKCAALTLRGRAPALPYLLCFIIPGWKGVFKMLQYMLATDCNGTGCLDSFRGGIS
jgi:hypothetical protein